MRVFISDLDSYVGRTLRRVLKAADEDVVIVGTVQATAGAGAGAGGGAVGGSGAAAAAVAGVKETVPMGSGGVADLARSADAIVLDITRTTPDTSVVIDAFRTGSFDEEEKVFVALSSVMTWMATKKAKDGSPFSESNFKRRKPTPLFAGIKTLESHVMSLARDGLRSHVVGAGILYGNGENALHSMFKTAWICEQPAVSIPVLEGGSGANVLPMIHVQDACSIVASVASSDPGSQYILAVDNAKSTLRDVTAAVSAALGPGPVEPLPAAEAATLLITDDHLPTLQADLEFEAAEATAASLGIEWVAQEGLIESIGSVIAEFVKHRNLRPVRSVLCGPPGAGKSLFSDAMGAKYYVPVVRTGDAVSLALDQARPEVTAAVGPILHWPEGLKEAVASVMKDKGRLPTKIISRVIHAVLCAPRVRNRGFVLDGFPRTYDEAKALFALQEEEIDFAAEAEAGDAAGDDADAEAEADAEVELDPAVLPSGVVFLDADEDVLEKRIVDMPESAVSGTHNTEEGFKRRLAAYRATNAPDGLRTVATFFEESAKMEVLEIRCSATTDVEATVERDIAPYVEKGGKSFNYHPTEEELAAREAAVKAEEAAKQAAAKLAADEEAKIEAEQREKLDAESAARLAEVTKQEAALLEARSAPLRQYLVANVIPSLTQGLLQVSKVKPSDPVDYLAEYLFKQSPAEGE